MRIHFISCLVAVVAAFAWASEQAYKFPSNDPEGGLQFSLKFFDHKINDYTTHVVTLNDFFATIDNLTKTYSWDEETRDGAVAQFQAGLAMNTGYISYIPYLKPTAYRIFRENVIHYLQGRFQYERYLEIGCENDLTFAEASSQYFKYSVGVDPNTGGTHRMTSDDFFASNTEKFDIVFVDGLHEANQAYRDIMNAMRFLNDNGSIVIHDGSPSTRLGALSDEKEFFAVGVDISGPFWNGDVYKAIIALRNHADVEVVTIDVDWGTAVLRKRQNKHPLSQKWRDYLGPNPISMLTYDHLVENRQELLRLVTVDDFVGWLDEEIAGCDGVCQG